MTSSTSNKRKAISTKTRFEIFNRDDFTCQYCGAKAPQVTLHVDHIIPVVEGGCNDDTNLITSCQSCNTGKGKRHLTAKALAKVTDNKVKEAKEHAKKMLEIANAQKSKEDSIKAINQIVMDKWIELGMNPNIESYNRKLFAMAKKYPLDDVLEGIELCVKRNPRTPSRAIKFLESNIKIAMEPQSKKNARMARSIIQKEFRCRLDDEWLPDIEEFMLVNELTVDQVAGLVAKYIISRKEFEDFAELLYGSEVINNA
jgi:hypothetical protein